MTTVLYPALFDIEEAFGPLAGYTYGNTFHGCACPYFPRASAETLLAALNTTEGVRAWYDAELDAYVIDDTHSLDDGPVAYVGQVHSVDGTPMTLYPIGHDQPHGNGTYWLWDEVA